MGSYKFGGNFTAALGVTDWERAKKFYGETLGLKQLFSADGMKWIEYSTGVENATIGVGATDKPVTPGGACPCLGVTDIEAAKADLEAKGVKFAGDIMTVQNMVKLATFHDPDGNMLMLAQMLVQP